MPLSHFEPILHQAERRAIVAVLRAHPEWTLGQLYSQLECDAPRAAVLRKLTFGELLAGPKPEHLERIAPAKDGGPAIDRKRLELAKQLGGPEFDRILHAVLIEAGGQAVAASYLRVRAGGPRWKLQASLRRLVDAGAVERSGTTSSTRYRATATARARAGQ